MRTALALLLILAGNVHAERVLILLAEGFNRGEFSEPYAALTNAGHQVDVASPAKGTVLVSPEKGPQPGKDAEANLTLADVDVKNYAALVIPGGYSPGNLEKHPQSLEICRQFMAAGKPVATICHGPRLLLRAGLLKDRTFTCLYSVADELADDWKAKPFGKYLDLPVIVDGNLITSRYPGDLALFNAAVLKALGATVTNEFPGIAMNFTSPKVPQTEIVLALRQGADESVVFAVTKTAEAQSKKLIKVASYPAEVPANALIIAPGGVWPEKNTGARQAEQPAWIEEQAKADTARNEWLLAQHKAGATLLLVGLDSLRLGRLEQFKGKKFACTDQAVWSFGKQGGKYSGEKALLTDTRLITTKGAGTLDAALKLLTEERP
jgi:protease I